MGFVHKGNYPNLSIRLGNLFGRLGMVENIDEVIENLRQIKRTQGQESYKRAWNELTRNQQKLIAAKIQDGGPQSSVVVGETFNSKNSLNHEVGNRKMENSVFIRIIGALALLLLGSYLFAEGLSNLILLPLVVVLAGLSGAQELSQAQALQNQSIIQVAFGIICLAGSLFVAFFKFETVKPHIPQLSIPQVSIPQLSKPSGLTTEELIAELNLRTART